MKFLIELIKKFTHEKEQVLEPANKTDKALAQYEQDANDSEMMY
tara:strand:+ start:847 stop:978 length:132 start_codon:yes stop_codon:yes gene_type:complete